MKLVGLVELVELVELVGPGLEGLGLGTKVVVMSFVGGVDVVGTVEPLIYCSLLHREQRLMV